MGRPHRAAEGGYVYHVLNRANARMTIFDNNGDYEAFERILAEAVARTCTRLLSYCVMPNHWHLVVWPRKDGELSKFVGWLTLTHTQRWHAHRHSTGSGHVYQGRFKSFPVAADEHFYTVARYVERNALRAKLVARAELWRWCSLTRWLRGSKEDRELLAAWPLAQGQLGRACQRATHHRGVGGSAAEHRSRPALRRSRLERTVRASARPGNDLATPWKTEETGKRFLTPFPDRGASRLPHRLYAHQMAATECGRIRPRSPGAHSASASSVAMPSCRILR